MSIGRNGKLHSSLYETAYQKYEKDHELYEKEYYTLLANLLNKHGAAVIVNTKTKKEDSISYFSAKG